jgi:alanine racemase
MRGERAWVEISLGALRHNLEVVRSCVGPSRKIIAVVKANAYGHGSVPVARELIASGVEALGVANVNEGIELRSAGIKHPILLLGAALPQEMAAGVEAGLTFTLSTFDEWDALEAVAIRLNKPVGAHIKFDTGMGRLGFFPDQVDAVAAKAARRVWVSIDAYYSHFAAADEDQEMTRRQGDQFKWIREQLPPRPWHIANSAGVLMFPEFHGDWVRPGLMLYGISPLENHSAMLKPVLSWKSRISLLRRMRAGMTISYGATYRLAQDAWIAVVSLGYADGFLRSLSGRGEVLLHGMRCKVCGRVTMDEIMIDVTRVMNGKQNVQVGDEVVLIGSSGGDAIDAAFVAKQAGTIPWEVLTGIGQRVMRFYAP